MVDKGFKVEDLLPRDVLHMPHFVLLVKHR